MAYAPIEDAEMLGAVGRGDDGALRLLYDRYSRMAFSLSYQIMRDSTLSEDIVQESFLVLWRSAPSFDPQRGNVRAWLLRIVRQRAIDYLRRAESRTGTSSPEAFSGLTATNDTSGAVLRRLDREAIHGAVRSLPPHQSQTIQLAFFEGYTHVEIADRLDIPLGTVKSRMRLGLNRLRRTLTPALQSDIPLIASGKPPVQLPQNHRA